MNGAEQTFTQAEKDDFEHGEEFDPYQDTDEAISAGLVIAGHLPRFRADGPDSLRLDCACGLVSSISPRAAAPLEWAIHVGEELDRARLLLRRTP